VNEVFCDDLRVTVPVESWLDLEEPLHGVLSDAGLAPEFRDDKRRQWRLDGGTVRSETFRVVRAISASGQALGRMRMLGLLGRFLSTLGSVPNKVTGLHATLDRAEATPPVFDRLMAQAASAAGLRAGRKRIPVSDLQRYIIRLSDGTDTGSMYCGPKSNEIRPVVYDKRQERMDKGLPDLGYDLTRYELRLRGVGATLRDAHDPTSIFWHYMAPDFLPAPASVVPWVAHGEGFAVDHPAALSPVERLQRRFVDSSDVADLIRLAASFDGGVDYLCHQIRKRAQAVDPTRTGTH
jgi:hypothetical protein